MTRAFEDAFNEEREDPCCRSLIRRWKILEPAAFSVVLAMTAYNHHCRMGLTWAGRLVGVVCAWQVTESRLCELHLRKASGKVKAAFAFAFTERMWPSSRFLDWSSRTLERQQQQQGRRFE